MGDQGRAEVEKRARIDATLATVREALNDLDYGSIVLTVHGSKVVQVEVTRKRRFDG